MKVVDVIGNRENVYCITRKGCNRLNLKFVPIYKNDKLNHFLSCSDFYFSYKSKGVPHIELEHQYYYNLNGRKYSFRPDLVIMILDRWYCVEMDLSGRRFESKVKEWEGYYTSGAFRKSFEKYPPIIIVSTNVDKVRCIIEKCGKVGLNYIYKDYEEVKNWDMKY